MGVKHELLEPLEHPDILAYIWSWFGELNRTRDYTENGRPKSITYMEIAAWSNLTKQLPSPSDTNLLTLIDGIAMPYLMPKTKK